MVLDGQSTEPLKVVKFRSLPAGWYEVIGAVYDGRSRMPWLGAHRMLVVARGDRLRMWTLRLRCLRSARVAKYVTEMPNKSRINPYSTAFGP